MFELDSNRLGWTGLLLPHLDQRKSEGTWTMTPLQGTASWSNYKTSLNVKLENKKFNHKQDCIKYNLSGDSGFLSY